MAKTISFKDTVYSKNNPRVDQYFLRNTLLPELEKQGLLGDLVGRVKVSPDGVKPEEYISLKEARDLTIDFLTNTGNLPEKRQRLLQNAKSYHEFSKLAWAFFFDNVETPQSAVNPDVITQYAALQNKPSNAPVMMRTRFSADERIKKYNELYNKILSYQYLGDTQRILGQLFPPGSKEAINFEQFQLAQIIAANLSRLQAANNSSADLVVKNHAVTTELNNIIARSYPKAAGFLNFTGDDQVKYALRRVVENFVKAAESDDPKILKDYEKTQIAASQAIREYAFNERELSAALNSTLSFIHNDQERQTLIRNLLRENNKRLFTGQDLATVIEHLAPNSRAKILEEIQKRNLDLSLNQLNNSLRASLNDNEFIKRGGLTKAEFNLLKNKGINPFLTTYTPWDKRFTINKAKSTAISALLSTYNSENSKNFKNLEEAYAYESRKNNPDPLFLLHARNHLNRNYYYGTLSDSERFSVDLARINRNFSNYVSKYQELLDRWDSFTEKFTIKVGKTHIPIFRIRNWIIDQWDKFKKLKIESWITSTSSATSSFGKFTHQRLVDYKLGGFTFKGMMSIGIHRAWSRMAYKATAGIVRGGTALSFRTATRFFLKIGAKTLAKATFKLSQLTISGALTLSGALSALGVVLLIKDLVELGAGLVKWGWNSVKDLLSRTDFSSTGILTALAMGWTTVLGFVTSLLFPWVLPSLISIGVFLGIVFGSVYYQNMMYQMLQTTARLDVGSSELQIPSGGSTTVDCFTFVKAGKTFPKNSDVNPSSTTTGWSSSDISLMTAAIEKMKSSHGKFIEAICRGGNINLWRDVASSVGWGGWAMSGSDIRIYNLGVSSALYTLSHELGHIYAVRVGGVNAFIGAGLVVWDTITGSCRNNIYPAQPTSEGACYGENFAELISWVISGHKSPPSSWAQWVYSNIFK